MTPTKIQARHAAGDLLFDADDIAYLLAELEQAKQDSEDNYAQGQKKGAIDAGSGELEKRCQRLEAELSRMEKERDEAQMDYEGRKASEEGAVANLNEWIEKAERLTKERNEEKEIVARVWKSLGITTYEEAKGREISEIVSTLRAENAKLKNFTGLAERALNTPIPESLVGLDAVVIERNELRAENAKLAEDKADLDWLLSKMSCHHLPGNNCAAWRIEYFDYAHREPTHRDLRAARKDGK